MAVGKIFWRTGAGAYYCKVDGKQVRLSTQLDHAEQKHRLLMIEHGATSNPTVADICHLYLDHVGKRNAAKTLERRQHTLNSLIAQYGTLDAKTLSAKHLSAWVEKERGWGATTKADSLALVSMVWSWASRNAHVKSSLPKLDKPTRNQREFFLPRDRWPEVIAAAGPAGEIFQFMFETGARPQEARILKQEHRRGPTFVLPPSQAKGKKKGRTIYLPPSLAVPIGKPFVFTNQKGRPWTKSSLNCAARRVKKKLKMPDFCAYTCRHSFAADRVSAGVEIAVVAKLMGHTTTHMVYTRYGHLDSQDQRMLAALS